MTTGPASPKIDLLLSLILLVVVSFVLAPPPQMAFEVTDLPEFFTGARFYCTGHAADIYDTAKFFPAEKELFPQLGERVIPLYVAPYGLPFLLPYLLFPAGIAYLGVKVMMLLVFTAAFFLSGASLRLSSKFILRTTVLLPFFGPVWEAIRVEQIAPILLLSLTGALSSLSRGRPLLAGLILSPFVMKPHLVLPIWFFLLGARRLKFCFSFLLCATGLILLSFLVCGKAAFIQYSALLNFSMHDLQWMAPQVTPTLRGQLLRLPFLDSGVATTISIAIYALLLVALVYIGHRFKSIDNSRIVTRVAMIAVPTGALLSIHCYAYDLILLLPAILMVVKELFDRSAATKGGPTVERQFDLVMAALFFFLPLLAFTLPPYGLIHYVLTLRGSLVNWHFICLVLLTGYLLARGLAPDPEEPASLPEQVSPA